MTTNALVSAGRIHASAVLAFDFLSGFGPELFYLDRVAPQQKEPRDDHHDAYCDHDRAENIHDGGADEVGREEQEEAEEQEHERERHEHRRTHVGGRPALGLNGLQPFLFDRSAASETEYRVVWNLGLTVRASQGISVQNMDDWGLRRFLTSYQA